MFVAIKKTAAAIFLSFLPLQVGVSICAACANEMRMDMPMDMPMSMPQKTESNAKNTPDEDARNERLSPPILDEFPSTSHVYSLSQLQTLAAANNPTLIQARTHVAAERGKALQAGLYRNPDLAYSGQLMGVRNAGMGEFQGGMIQQEIILGGKLKYSRKKYQSRQSAAEEQEKAQHLRVMNDVAIAYYKTLAAQHKVIVHEDFVNSARDSWLTRREMLNTGEANQADIHQVNAAFEKAKLDLLAAKNDLRCEWQQLACVVGINADSATVSGNIESDEQVAEWPALLQNLLSQSPELLEAKAKLRSDEITLIREHRQAIPNLLLCAGPGYDQIDKSVAAVVTASVTNIPLFNRNQGTIIQAKADLTRQQAQVRLVELQLRSKLAHQYRTYQTAKQHVDGYRAVVVPESRARYQINLKSYQNARVDWSSVLDSQKDFLQSKLAYINQLVELKTAEVELKGFVLTGGLLAPTGVTPPGHIDATPNPR